MLDCEIGAPLALAAIGRSTRRSSMWKVGQVMSVGVGDGVFGYGFNVTTSRNQPLVLFAYETREAAEAAAQQIEAAVERAVLVRPFPV
jgi:hypothetical protein